MNFSSTIVYCAVTRRESKIQKVSITPPVGGGGVWALLAGLFARHLPNGFRIVVPEAVRHALFPLFPLGDVPWHISRNPDVGLSRTESEYILCVRCKPINFEIPSVTRVISRLYWPELLASYLQTIREMFANDESIVSSHWRTREQLQNCSLIVRVRTWKFAYKIADFEDVKIIQNLVTGSV